MWVLQQIGNTTGGQTTGVGTITTVDYGVWDTRLSQSFQVSASFILSSFTLSLVYIHPQATGDLVVRVETDNAGVRSGTLVGASFQKTIPHPIVTGSILVDFGDTITLAANTKYWIVFLCDTQPIGGGNDDSIYWNFAASSTNTYLNGDMLLSLDGGSTWTYEYGGGRDVYFSCFALVDVESTDIEPVCGEVAQAVAEVTDLSHLNGMTVSILADGEVLDQQVVSGGSIDLPGLYSKIHVGLPYESDIETLNIEVEQKDGILQGRRIKIGNVVFRVVNTRGGWIGPNEEEIYEALPNAIEFKQGSNSTDMFTGDIRMPLGSGFEEGGRIFYKQLDPLPVTITAIIPEMTPGGHAG